jgi:hypothetical protein
VSDKTSAAAKEPIARPAIAIATATVAAITKNKVRVERRFDLVLGGEGLFDWTDPGRLLRRLRLSIKAILRIGLEGPKALLSGVLYMANFAGYQAEIQYRFASLV